MYCCLSETLVWASGEQSDPWTKLRTHVSDNPGIPLLSLQNKAIPVQVQKGLVVRIYGTAVLVMVKRLRSGQTEHRESLPRRSPPETVRNNGENQPRSGQEGMSALHTAVL